MNPPDGPKGSFLGDVPPFAGGRVEPDAHPDAGGRILETFLGGLEAWIQGGTRRFPATRPRVVPR